MFDVLHTAARRLCVWTFLVPGTIFARDLFVTTNGTPSGTGTMERPYDLVTALSGQVGQPGDTFWLRTGNYVIGHIDTKIHGAPGQPITFRQWPGERASVDGSLAFFDSTGYVVLRDFELFSSDTNRLSTQTNAGFAPTDISIIPGIASYVPNMSFINLVVHDETRHGFYISHECSNNVIYGCIVFNNGWWSPDNAEGHGLYVQGDEGAREAADNMVFNNSGVGFHIYENGTNVPYLTGITLDGNVAFGAGAIQNVRQYPDWIIGVDKPAVNADRIIVKNNMGYDTPASAGINQVQIGRDGINGSVAILNNYFPQGLAMKNWFIAAVSGNVIGSTSTGNPVVNLDQTQEPLTAVWHGNTYFSPGTGNDFSYNSNNLDFTGWQSATGFDQDSVFNAGAMSGTKVFIRPNRYEKGRANIIVYNWAGQSNVAVDVSSVLTPGAPYEVRNAEDFFAVPVLRGVYGGQPLSLPMTGLTVAKPKGPMLAPPPTGPTLNVFILLPIVVRLDAKLTNGTVELSWETNAVVDWVLQSRASLSPGHLWSDVTNTPVLTGTREVVDVVPVGAAGFFRLRSPFVWLLAEAVGSDAMELSWSANAGNWILQFRPSLSGADRWADVTNIPIIAGQKYGITLPMTGPMGFYRLRPAIE